MAIITTKDYFYLPEKAGIEPIDGHDWSVWSSPGVLIDGIKDNQNSYTTMKKSGYYSSQHITYYYKFSIPENTANDLKFTLYPHGVQVPVIHIGLYYGNKTNRTLIGTELTLKLTSDMTRDSNPIEINFNFTEANKQVINSHRNELILGIYLSTSSNALIQELEIWVPDTSKIYVGTSQASAVYVGNTKANAVYIGTTKIL